MLAAGTDRIASRTWEPTPSDFDITSLNTCVVRFSHQYRIYIQSKHEDVSFGRHGSDLTGCLESVHDRHREIQESHIGMELSNHPPHRIFSNLFPLLCRSEVSVESPPCHPREEFSPLSASSSVDDRAIRIVQYNRYCIALSTEDSQPRRLSSRVNPGMLQVAKPAPIHRTAEICRGNRCRIGRASR